MKKELIGITKDKEKYNITQDKKRNDKKIQKYIINLEITFEFEAYRSKTERHFLTAVTTEYGLDLYKECIFRYTK